MSLSLIGKSALRGARVSVPSSSTGSLSQKKSVARLHTTSHSASWRSMLRPDLIPKKLKRGEKEEPKTKEARRADNEFWRNASTKLFYDKLKIAMTGPGSVRPGIAKIFLLKAHTREHIELALQCYGWLQARYKKDLGSHEATLLLKAMARADTPDLAIQLFGKMTWIRCFPDSPRPFNVFYSYLASKAEHVLLFQSPAEVIDYTKDEYVPPVVEDKKAAAKKGPASRFQQQEEEEEEEVSTRKVKEIAPEIAVVQNFQAWQTIVNDPRFGLKENEYSYVSKARFYAANGDTNNTTQSLSFVPSAPVDIMMNLHLKNGQPAKAIEHYTSFKHKQIPSDRAARALVASHLALGQVDQAYEVIKAFPTSVLLVQAHMGNAQTFETLKSLYDRAEQDGVNVAENVKKYVTDVEAHLAKIEEAKAAAKAAAEEAAAAAAAAKAEAEAPKEAEAAN